MHLRLGLRKVNNCLNPLDINTNSNILDVYQGSECVTESATKEKVTQLHVSLTF